MPTRAARSAPPITGVVFTGGWDGILRAVDSTGKVMWRYDTRREFQTVNGVNARGGSLGSPGPTIADGMVYVASGYPGMQGGYPGNVILAFSAE
jgi:polyvinyl alcohol dehydrogenase (cytochrome)